MKTCNLCNKEKKIIEFVKRSNRTSGTQPYCKDCHNKKMRNKYDSKVMKDYDLKRAYGIDLKKYEDMFLEQKGCCKICNKHISQLNNKHKKSLCVDHCHETKKIRGLLCDKCNRGIGLLNDDVKILSRAIEYLKNNEINT